MKCMICNKEIYGRYLTDVWQQTICAGHLVEYCSSCGRFVKPSDFHLSDGRCFCTYCSPSAVTHSLHVEWVEERVRSVLSTCGIFDIPENIPIHLVTPAEMARFTGSRQINLQQLGLTLTAKTVGLFWPSCRHDIYIFSQIPRVQFAGVLAHELLHAWQNEKKIVLPPLLTEGFCNTGSYIIYGAIHNDLSRHFIRNLENDLNPVYGGGFRKVVQIYKRVRNLSEVMRELQTNVYLERM